MWSKLAFGFSQCYSGMIWIRIRRTPIEEPFMRKIIILSIASVFIALSAQSFADKHDPNLKLIKARQSLMQLRVFNAGPLFGMAKGKMPYDAEMAASLATNLKLLSEMNMGRAWAGGTGNDNYPGKTKALPKIWSTYPEIAEYGKKYMSAVDALASAAGNGLDELRANIGNLGKACKACHDDFREEM
jgi:cytochrome c556